MSLFQPTACPFCEQFNACNVADIAHCWCTQKMLPKALLALLKSEQAKRCICQSCIDLYQQDPEAFTRAYKQKLV